MKKAALAQVPVPEPSVTYRAIIADIELKYAPNKPVDIESWQKKAQAINCRDGRGFQTNCNEFIEALEELTTLNAAPDRMMIQRWISEHFLKDAPSDFRSRLPAFGALNATDAVAGAVQPAVPRWRTFLNELASDISNFASWDYIKDSDKKAEGRTVTIQQVSATSYCYRCGKYGHAKKDCTSTRCVCGIYMNKLPNGHNTGDSSHDAKRVELLKLYNERNKKSSADRGTRPGGRGADGGRNPSGRGGRGRGATQVKGGSNQSSQNSKSASGKDGKADAKVPLADKVTSLIESAAAQTDQMTKLLKSHDKLKVKLARTLDAQEDAESESSDDDDGKKTKTSTALVVSKKKRRTG
jgi:hypothetical protein